jgi:hypothetical protein
MRSAPRKRRKQRQRQHPAAGLVGSALRIAACRPDSMGVMMGGMGMGMGMNGMEAVSERWAAAFSIPAQPRNSMVTGFSGMASGLGAMPGMGDPSDSALRETVSKPSVTARRRRWSRKKK